MSTPTSRSSRRLPGNWITEDARAAFSNALPSISDFSGVFAQNDSEAAGVIAALDAQGITGKPVTGFDGNAQNIQLIADGKQLLTSATIGGLTAALLGVAVFDVLNGVEFSLPERFMYQGAVLVQQDFAQEFLDNIYGGNLPFDWELMSQALHPDDWDPQTLLQPIVPADFFAGAEPGDVTINSAWDAETDNSRRWRRTTTPLRLGTARRLQGQHGRLRRPPGQVDSPMASGTASAVAAPHRGAAARARPDRRRGQQALGTGAGAARRLAPRRHRRGRRAGR